MAGGPKYQEADEARQIAASRYTKSQQQAEKDAKTRDEQFMNTGRVHRVRIAGKFKQMGEFNRVMHFPHQSGYVNQSDREGGSVASTSAWMTSVRGTGTAVTGSLAAGEGKKTHKFGKRRVKDRSWRA